jgi:hypothetical protein
MEAVIVAKGVIVHAELELVVMLARFLSKVYFRY